MLLKGLFVTHLHLKPLSFWGQGVTKAPRASSQGPSGAQAPGGPQGCQMESQARAPLEPGPLHSVEGVPPSVRPWAYKNKMMGVGQIGDLKSYEKRLCRLYRFDYEN